LKQHEIILCVLCDNLASLRLKKENLTAKFTKVQFHGIYGIAHSPKPDSVNMSIPWQNSVLG